MEKEELEEKMRIIFNRASDIAYSGESLYSYKSLGKGSLTEIGRRGLLSNDPSLFELDFPILETLKKLYNSIEDNNELKKLFVKLLINHIEDSMPIVGSKETSDPSILSFATLINLGFIREALDILSTKSRKIYVGELLCFLFNYIHYEYPKLTDSDLALLEFIKEVNSDSNYLNLIRQQINKLRYETLRREMEGINLEINQDRKKAIEKMKYFGFGESVAEFLNKAEKYYWDTSKDEFDWKMVTGSLREASNEFIKGVASRIKERLGDEYPKEKQTPIGNMRLYIRNNLELGHEDELYDVLIDIINDKGAHKLITDKEYFRLAKNMIIEIFLLILTKLEKFENPD
jgi:hypothetical protein